MKVLLSVVVLALLGTSGCCLVDKCTEEWVLRDAAVDTSDADLGGGVDARTDGLTPMADASDEAGVDAIGDTMLPDAMLPPECAENMTCAAKDEGRPFCDLQIKSGSCRKCLADVECSGRADRKLVCSMTGTKVGQCVQCNTSAQCTSADNPFCDPLERACRPCVQDSECGGPGICLDHLGGRCATAAEVLYVEFKMGCDSGNGTSASPFCSPSAAIDEAKKTPTRRVIVLTGTKELASFSVALPVGESLTIVGKGPAIADDRLGRPGVALTQGTLYLRGVTIRDFAVSAGIVAEGQDSKLVVVRGFIHHNADGGIKISNKAAFTIKDTFVTENGTDQASAASGILIQGAAIPKDKRELQNVSVLNNSGNAPGLTCDSEISASGVLAFSGAQKSISLTCPVANCCVDPKFNASFKLQSTSGSLCFDQVPSAKNTLDAFGQLRLDAGDCGADEKDVP